MYTFSVHEMMGTMLDSVLFILISHFGILEFIYFIKKYNTMYLIWCREEVLHLPILCINRFNKTESDIFEIWVNSLLSKDPFIQYPYGVFRVLYKFYWSEYLSTLLIYVYNQGKVLVWVYNNSHSCYNIALLLININVLDDFHNCNL